MPIYEFKCEAEHITEGIYTNLSSIREIVCQVIIEVPSITGDTNLRTYIPCGRKAEKIFSIPANPQIAPSTVIYRDLKTGKVETAHSRNQANPKGMVKEELKGPFERSKFEREQQRLHNVENEMVTQRNFAIKDQARKNRHSDINSRMNTVEVNSNENPQLTKDLLKMAMDRSNKKELPHKKTEFHLAVNHQDRNNLDKG